MTGRFWSNNDTSLWKINPNDEPTYLSCIGINNIEWGNAISSACPYCGSAMKDGICEGCGNRATSNLDMGDAIVIFEGPMPPAMTIFNTPSVLELHFVECGNLGWYWNYDGRLIMENCEVVERWMPNISTIHCNDAGMIILFVKVKCHIVMEVEPKEAIHPYSLDKLYFPKTTSEKKYVRWT